MRNMTHGGVVWGLLPKRQYAVGLLLAHRLRRWPNSRPILRLVIAGYLSDDALHYLGCGYSPGGMREGDYRAMYAR